MKPLDFFKVAGDDVAAGRAPIDWERCPGMEVVLEMRLEADATRGGAGAMYGSGKVSTRSLDVRQKVSAQMSFVFAVYRSTGIISTAPSHGRDCSVRSK